jgi:hypothetical protein
MASVPLGSICGPARELAFLAFSAIGEALGFVLAFAALVAFCGLLRGC